MNNKLKDYFRNKADIIFAVLAFLILIVTVGIVVYALRDVLECIIAFFILLALICHEDIENFLEKRRDDYNTASQREEQKKKETFETVREILFSDHLSSFRDAAGIKNPIRARGIKLRVPNSSNPYLFRYTFRATNPSEIPFGTMKDVLEDELNDAIQSSEFALQTGGFRVRRIGESPNIPGLLYADIDYTENTVVNYPVPIYKNSPPFIDTSDHPKFTDEDFGDEEQE